MTTGLTVTGRAEVVQQGDCRADSASAPAAGMATEETGPPFPVPPPDDITVLLCVICFVVSPHPTTLYPVSCRYCFAHYSMDTVICTFHSLAVHLPRLFFFFFSSPLLLRALTTAAYLLV